MGGWVWVLMGVSLAWGARSMQGHAGLGSSLVALAQLGQAWEQVNLVC